MSGLLLIPILLPILAGGLLPLFKLKDRKALWGYVLAALSLELLLVAYICIYGEMSLKLFDLTGSLAISLKADGAGRLFMLIAAFCWLMAGIFSTQYMKHEQSESRFCAFLLLTLGALMGLFLSGNLITLYLCYELTTLLSMPLVLHSLTKEAVSAALKYLFYSIAGAFMALLGIFYIFNNSTSIDFTPGGGLLDAAKVGGNEGLMLAVVFIMLLGFGVKAGLVPMHGWLPAAHPVAPAPASALLSGVIAKAGVFTTLRVIYYVIGPDALRGTWVQYAYVGLILVTIFTGSMMACRQDNLKRRLAYSTVSQISYILLGLALMLPDSVTGGLMHVVFHAAIKNCLFLIAGAIIFTTGCTNVSQLRGIGKKMPVTIWCWTLCSLALIGIPPTSGFVSKWFLATAALNSGLTVLNWLSPVILLVSALLTASYLLPITISGFFPGQDFEKVENREPKPAMTVPIVILTVLSVGLGIWAEPVMNLIKNIVSAIV